MMSILSIAGNFALVWSDLVILSVADDVIKMYNARHFAYHVSIF